jgi:carbamoyl-phosphate synthase small subunit
MVSRSMARRCRQTLVPTHVSLFDGSLQGIARSDVPAFSFQGHPEASPGPHDIAHLFDHFVQMMQDKKGQNAQTH